MPLNSSDTYRTLITQLQGIVNWIWVFYNNPLQEHKLEKR